MFLFFATNSYAIPPVEYTIERYSFTPFFSGDYQEFTGASSHMGFYFVKQKDTSFETPNNLMFGLKGGKIDVSLDRIAWFIKRDVSLTDSFYASLKYNHTVYKTYKVGENVCSIGIGFQGFFNATNLFYTFVGGYYRFVVLGGGYRIPLKYSSEMDEFYFLVNMGYKYFSDDGSAFSVDVNNYNDFSVYNLGNIGFDFIYSSIIGDGFYYIVKLEIRTSGLLIGTGMINEERFLLGLGINFGGD